MNTHVYKLKEFKQQLGYISLGFISTHKIHQANSRITGIFRGSRRYMRQTILRQEAHWQHSSPKSHCSSRDPKFGIPNCGPISIYYSPLDCSELQVLKVILRLVNCNCFANGKILSDSQGKWEYFRWSQRDYGHNSNKIDRMFLYQRMLCGRVSWSVKDHRWTKWQ